MYMYQVIPEDIPFVEIDTLAKDGFEAVIDQHKQKSDFKFEEFLDQVIAHSNGDEKNVKPIKLNFKQFKNLVPRCFHIILKKHREVSACAKFYFEKKSISEFVL